ncbi:MAG: hypothetical protein IJJ13_10570 [Lachnospiraceae bacterium]|nr:hypothetical protein [Lachnospiraceae bacterium]
MDEQLRLEKDKQQEIVVNKEVPELILANKKEHQPPNPEEIKKDQQVRKLDADLKKRKPRMNKRLIAQVHNPEIFQPQKIETEVQEPPAYEELKKENLQKESVVTNKMARINIETDKKISSQAKLDDAQMKLIKQSLQEKAAAKKELMLSMNNDPGEAEYITACVDLDMLMKLHAACETTMKDPKAKKAAQATLMKLIRNKERRLKEHLAEKAKMEKAKQKEQEKTAKTVKTLETPVEKKSKKETKKKEVKKDSLYKVVINDRKDKKKTKYQDDKLTRFHGSVQNPFNLLDQERYQQGEIITYKHTNGQTYTMVKQQPANLKEAIQLRGQITRNFNVMDGHCPDQLFDLFLYYEEYVVQFSENQEIEFPPEYLQKIDISPYAAEGKGLEVAVALRNRIMDGGLLYKDLKGQAKEVYDYYDEIVKHLIRTDGTMKDRVDQHEARKESRHNIQLKTNLDKTYEEQAGGSNDCWSCAGSAIINHFLRNEPGYKTVTAKKFRAFQPALKTKEELGVDDESYETQKSEIEEFTIKNQSKNRTRSPMGNPYMVADFYLNQLEKAGKKNTAVRKMVFQPGLAAKQKNGFTDQSGKNLGKDTNALHNLRQKFKDVVKEALEGDSALTLLSGAHYLTIVGIRGNQLIVHNSASGTPGVTEIRSIDSILADRSNQKAVELVWLQKIEDPKDVTRQFKNLSYDENTKQYREKVKNFSENIGQQKGVGAWKALDEKDEDIADLIMEGIYLPKQLQA